MPRFPLDVSSALISLIVAGWLPAAVAGDLAVNSKFSGGSANLVQLDQKTRLIRINPTPHLDRGWTCWWYFQVTGIQPGETLTIDVGDAPWATPDQATFSEDQKSWKHTPPGVRQGKRITYQQKIEGNQAWFAWGPPFTVEDAATLVTESEKKCPAAKAFELCRTREDRPVPALRIDAAPQTPDRYGIYVCARQHAWEAGGSWVCRGFTEWLISNDDRAVAVRKKAVIVIVPVMDIDNVAIGAGGKEQKPQDHNRDWTDKPYHKSVAASQQEITKLNAAKTFDLFLDLHNPAASDKQPMFFVSPKEILTKDGQENLDRFLKLAQLEMTGPLAFKGLIKESGPNYDRRWEVISKNWVTKHTAPHVVSATLETSWNTPESTTDGYRQIGRELGQTIERYLRVNPRIPNGR